MKANIIMYFFKLLNITIRTILSLVITMSAVLFLYSFSIYIFGSPPLPYISVIIGGLALPITYLLLDSNKKSEGTTSNQETVNIIDGIANQPILNLYNPMNDKTYTNKVTSNTICFFNGVRRFFTFKKCTPNLADSLRLKYSEYISAIKENTDLNIKVTRDIEDFHILLNKVKNDLLQHRHHQAVTYKKQSSDYKIPPALLRLEFMHNSIKSSVSDYPQKVEFYKNTPIAEILKNTQQLLESHNCVCELIKSFFNELQEIQTNLNGQKNKPNDEKRFMKL